MFGFIRSIRARRNTRKQVNGWIKELKKGIHNREKELAMFMKIAPLTPSNWDDKMIPILEELLSNHKKRLKEYTLLKKKYEEDGLI